MARPKKSAVAAAAESPSTHGLHNVGEFYSQHYLDSLLLTDLGETLEAFRRTEREGGRRAPGKELLALRERFYAARGAAEGIEDAGERLDAGRDFHLRFCEALGYPRCAEAVQVDDGRFVPLLAAVHHAGRAKVWVLEAPFPRTADEAAPLEAMPHRAQLPSELVDDAANQVAESPYAELFDEALFRVEDAARFVLLLGGTDLFVIDRHKWPQGRYLRFDLAELYDRREAGGFELLTALAHRQVLAPEADGQPLLDKLDERSHKHAFEVTTALGESVREAIELLANEVVRYRREVQKQGVFDRPELADELTRECIVFLYRLLFLFYVESRDRELGVVSMRARAYREGYGLEFLRQFELRPLETEAEREGFFLDESLRQLFRVVQHGHPSRQRVLGTDTQTAGFVIAPLRSALFDEEQTPLLRSVKLRNFVLQQVIERLSLTRPQGKKARGRISYAQLGINQLGAVYEGLLSYRGFFAASDVLEVRSGEQSYFVAEARRAEFDDALFVRDAQGRAVRHAKGTYLFRMASRDREKSASYYTPEVLTRCLVKYTLLERLGRPFGRNDERPEGARLPRLSADAMLDLTLCEPAMGSGAFLVEAIDQLADFYLAAKQEETGQRIPADAYFEQKQRVKHHFAANRCYGVDLNPLAAELGKVSLWLATLHPGGKAPFLDLRIRTGNSLVGARRAFFPAAELMRKPSKDVPNYTGRVPDAVRLGENAPEQGVHHFLVGDEGMVGAAEDKTLKQLLPDEAKAARAWRSAFVAPYAPLEVERLRKVSERVEALWQRHLQERRGVLETTRRRIAVFGQAGELASGPDDAQTAAEAAKALELATAPGKRLERVMGYWCALFFWPLTQASALPRRDAWLSDLEALTDPAPGPQGFVAGASQGLEARLDVVDALIARHRFFHWELAFAEVFAERGGMDVILGNPPWRKVEWQEGDVLADFDPALAVKKLSAKKWSNARDALLEDGRARAAYVAEIEEATGTQGFLNTVQMYPLLQGVQTNLYKCFIERAGRIGAAASSIGILHQKGLFDDPKGGALRAALALRASLHLHFINKLLLFQDIEDQKHFELTVYQASARAEPLVFGVSNLFHPATLDESFAHDGQGGVPGIKTADGNWDLRGHRSRIVPIDREALALFATLFDEAGTPPEEARLPVVHSREVLGALRRFATAERLAARGDWTFVYDHLDESRQQADGTIRRDTQQAATVRQWIIQGPHFYVGNPFNKTPNEGCAHNQDYSSLDLTRIEDGYLPRTNYVPACSADEYARREPTWNGHSVLGMFRHVHREMVPPTGERTLAACLIPPGAAHVHTVLSLGFATSEQLLAYHSMALSLPVDFFVKSTGMGHVNVSLASRLPLVPPGVIRSALSLRALRLNCLTTHYAPLWEELFDPSFRSDVSTTTDPRTGIYSDLPSAWHRDVALRTPFARRQALVEIDALAALALGMTFEELRLIYEVQFPVLQQYERETFYDRRGKIVFTVNRGLTGVGLDRAQWEEICDAQAGDPLPEWARDQGGAFVPPFDARDRVTDMHGTYVAFARRFGLDEATGRKLD